MLYISLQCAQTVNVKCDGFELRLDAFPRIDKEEIQLLCKKLSRPVIFTLRKASQGGHFTGSESERLTIIETLLALKPDLIDLEYDTDSAFVQKVAEKFPATKILLSYHNFEHTPSDLPSLLEKMASPYAYAYKIATMAHSTLDSLRMLSFIKSARGKKVSGICMGKEGEITRILGPVFGSYIDYAPLEEAAKTAPGQIPISDLCKIYHYPSLNPSTALFALIGDPVDKSIAYLTHNTIMRHYGWNAVYVRMKVCKEELPDFMHLAKECGFLGLSVTMPLKEEILPLLDRIDSEAQKMGAVNTVHFKEQMLFGYNTDGKGALSALQDKTAVRGKKVILLGAGGAAKAIAHEAHHRGADLLILNRTKERALALAQEIGCRGGGLEDISAEKYDIIINAAASPLPIDPSFLIPKTVAMETKTLPRITPFLQEAEKRGCTLIYGYEMFVYQAVEQFRIWFHREIDKELLEKECLKVL